MNRQIEDPPCDTRQSVSVGPVFTSSDSHHPCKLRPVHFTRTQLGPRRIRWSGTLTYRVYAYLFMVSLTTLSVGQTITVSNHRMISENVISSCKKKEIIG